MLHCIAKKSGERLHVIKALDDELSVNHDVFEDRLILLSELNSLI